MINRIIAFSILLLGTLNLLAQDIPTSSIRGQISDQVTGFPLVGATVHLANSEPPIGGTSDANGYFELQNLPIGRHSLIVSYMGYDSQNLNNILVNSGKQTFVNVYLTESPFTMEEVIVKAKSKKENVINDMAQVSGRTFSVEETERFAGSLGDPARMVANYAGVMTQNDSRNDIIIRGNSPMGVLWRLEGIEIPNPNHFGALGTTGGPVSMVNNNLLNNSDFLTGAFPAEYGNALAGAFDLNLRSGNNKAYEFMGQVGFNGFELGAEGPLYKKKSGVNPSFLANFRYSTLELMDHIGLSAGTGTAIPQYKDLTYIVDLPQTKLGRFKVIGLWGSSYIELGNELSDTSGNSYNARGTATKFGSTLGVIALQNTKYFTKKLRLKSTVSYQTTRATTKLDSVKISKGIRYPWLRSEQVEDKITLNTQLRQKLNAKNNYSLGITADYQMIDYLDSIKSGEQVKFDRMADVEGNYIMLRAYAQWQHQLSSSLNLYAGLNGQYFNLNDEFVIEPRLSLLWKPNSKNSFSVGFGKHSQLQPKVVYFYQEFDSTRDVYTTTNKILKFSRSNHFIAGYQLMAGPNFRIKAETYYQKLYKIPVSPDFVEFSLLNAGDNFGIPREPNLQNTGKGENYGIEITLEKFLDNGYYFLITGSLFESKYKGFDNVERNTAFNGNHVLNALGGYEFKIGMRSMFTIDAKIVWAGGKRYVPIDMAKSKTQGKEVRDWNRAYDEKFADYFRTDVRFGFKLNGKNMTQEWGLDLQNLTGYKSIFAEGYDPANNEIYTIFQQGFLPMMLYRINF